MLQTTLQFININSQTFQLVLKSVLLSFYFFKSITKRELKNQQKPIAIQFAFL
ncbi:MAG: hypothetical protein RI955_1839 [Bacteroidota bacterium]